MLLDGKVIARIRANLRGKIRGEAPTEVLVGRGLRLGSNFSHQEQCIIDESHCWLISIGDNVTLAPRVHILAHDASTKLWLGYTKIARVTIGSRVFIGAGSIVLPGVQIGDDVVIGAGSVVRESVPSNTLAFGNPARSVCQLDTYIEKNRHRIAESPTFGVEFTVRASVSESQKSEMLEQLRDTPGYIV